MVYALSGTKMPDICGTWFYLDGAVTNRKLRKRHARYRRGREAVRPRHRRSR